ncbi:conserved oligomeric Golgi complex subunit 1 isoform X2 [Copidosoma floridanum]|uniref:conserved oligomeric Golgi complex subunit 1 isoform X2 n=1 Tax=Copidosoma floridanum TaxID=29053 RepID=UPI0006C94557|nr:conserved oligomeric Golgi complex subunit 1 isoform X2 [Copidosoma floridanum]
MSFDYKITDVDLDVKKLFENHTIKEIELILKQVQQELDRKKIELRTLVGERYRDLIEAADTISEMQQTSEEIVTKIVNVQEKFSDLHQQYLIGFNMDAQQRSIPKETSDISDSVVMQIKILMDIPEQIWSAIDDKNFLLATQLFLLAQHINYSLTFEVGDDLPIKYPIVSKQWSIINQFKNLINTFCIESLQSIELSTETAANSLAALSLLDGLNSCELLNKLIFLRKQTITSLITSESNYNVKNKIKLSLSILMKTIPLISHCFTKYGDFHSGLVSHYIDDIKQQDAIFLLCQLDLDEELMNEFLPLTTKSYKPFKEYDLEKIPIDSIQESVKTFFDWIKQITLTEVKKLLNLITSIKGVYSIREECLAVSVPENWEHAWETFSLPSSNFWLEFFQPLLTDRVKDILNEKLSLCFDNLKTNASKLFGEVTSDSCRYAENDLRWYVWKDEPTDVPQNLMKGANSDAKRPLLMKARAFSPNLIKLCDSFESDLSEFLSHLKQYLYELEQPVKLKNDSLAADIYLTTNKFCDRNEIQEYLQKTGTKCIEDFIVCLKHEFTIDNPRIGKQNVNAIVAARFLQALPTLCTHFKECFTMSRSSSLTLSNAKWQEICDKLKLESAAMWSVWAKCFTKNISHHRNVCLIKETDNELRIHVVIADWEKVMIEEEAEEGKRIKSEILVPHQPAVHLQKFLASICQDLNKIIPHTMPRAILNEIINNIAAELLDYYDKLCVNPGIRQKQAMQILFDVKYLSLLMVPRDSKLLAEKSNQVCSSITSKIDPFDLDVFYPFINANVKKSVQRTLLIFGSLVPHMEQLHSVLGAKMSEHSEGVKLAVKDPPGVLALCSGSPWFPPLAVTAPIKNPSAPLPAPLLEKSQRRKQTGKEQAKSDSTGSTIKSGAAAFFGAMGSDWFGSS